MTEPKPTPTELPADYQDKINLLHDLVSKRKELEEHINEIKADLRANLGRGHYTINGEPVVRLDATKRFSEARAREILPDEVLQQCYRNKIDASLAKELLPPALYDACQEETKNDTVNLD